MPDWLPGVLSGLFLFSFIGYAFYQGFQVKPKDLPSVINEGEPDQSAFQAFEINAIALGASPFKFDQADIRQPFDD